ERDQLPVADAGDERLLQHPGQPDVSGDCRHDCGRPGVDHQHSRPGRRLRGGTAGRARLGVHPRLHLDGADLRRDRAADTPVPAPAVAGAGAAAGVNRGELPDVARSASSPDLSGFTDGVTPRPLWPDESRGPLRLPGRARRYNGTVLDSDVPGARGPVVMRPVLFHFCLLTLVALGAGCAGISSSRYSDAPRPNAPPPQAVVFVVDGVGNFGATSNSLRQAAEEAGQPLHIHTVDWSHGYARIFADHMDRRHALNEGRKLAEQIACYQQPRG